MTRAVANWIAAPDQSGEPDLSLELQHIVIALGLGLLVGTQRTWAGKGLAGIRTFPLVTVLGVLAERLATVHGGAVLAGALLAVVSLIIMGNWTRVTQGLEERGITTEVALIVMFAVGAMVSYGWVAEGVIVAGSAAALLQWKDSLHALVQRLGDADARALMRLALLGLVILPALPNRTFGPYGVLNPFSIWLMVVLIVGISMGAYLAARLLGPRGGTLASGVLGGLISSTATTVTYARRSAGAPERSAGAALVVMLASTVVFARVLLEVAVVAPQILPDAGLPIATMMLVMLGISGVMYYRSRGEVADEPPEHEPPSDLRAAVGFGLLYAGVLLAVAVAREHFGAGAVYGVAALSGLTDVDAITLSTAQLVQSGRLDVETGWRVILVGALTNLMFKGFVVASLGAPQLLKRIALSFGMAVFFGVLLLLFWPG